MKVKQIHWDVDGKDWYGTVGDAEEGVEIYFHIARRQQYGFIIEDYRLSTDSSLSELGHDGEMIYQGTFSTLEAAQCAAQKFLEKCVQSLIED